MRTRYEKYRNSRWNIEEEMIREFEGIAIETIQNETEKSMDLWGTLSISLSSQILCPAHSSLLALPGSQPHVLRSGSPLGTL